MKKLFFPLGVLVIAFLSQCAKESQNLNDAPASENNLSGAVTERSNCNCQFKINSLSPSSAGFLTTIRHNFNNTLYHISEETCFNTENNTLNTWYNFTFPQNQYFRLTLHEIIDPNGCERVSGSMNYSVKCNGVTSTETLNVGTQGTASNVFFVNNQCTAAKR